MDQREGVELLALGKFFGMTSDPRFHQDQERLKMLTEEAFTYEGQAEVIEQIGPLLGRTIAGEQVLPCS